MHHKTVAIAGEQFVLELPYAEAHILTAPEAVALNRAFVKNLRSAFASTVAKAKEDGTFALEAMQKTFTDFAAAYKFGSRITGGRASDPLLKVMRDLARAAVKSAIIKAGEKVSDYTAAAINLSVDEFLAKPAYAEAVRAEAESQVEGTQKLLKGFES